MDSPTKLELESHVNAIPAILFKEAAPNDLKTLGGIEKSVRSLAQEYVLPQLGLFLSTVPQRQNLEKGES